MIFKKPLKQKLDRPLVWLACYSATMASLIDQYCDTILVGDSLNMTLYGKKSTLTVDIETMKRHGRAIVDTAQNASVVVDMPFGFYADELNAYKNAADILSETDCNAIKIEGGKEIYDIISFLSKRGIPVVGHVGLMPQKIKKLNSYKHLGSSNSEFSTILEDALAVEEAGAECIVLECINEQIAKEITARCTIPTIGIGASPHCSGQVLVLDDIIGLSGFKPKFAEIFSEHNVAHEIKIAAEKFSNAVKNGSFPSTEHCYGNKDSMVNK